MPPACPRLRRRKRARFRNEERTGRRRQKRKRLCAILKERRFVIKEYKDGLASSKTGWDGRLRESGTAQMNVGRMRLRGRDRFESSIGTKPSFPFLKVFNRSFKSFL